MHMGDICAWSSPADPHQLQSAFRPGGPRMQVSCAASLSLGVRKRTHPEVHSKKKTTSDFSIFQKWVNDRMELQKKQTFWVIFPFFFVVLNLWNRTMIRLFIFDSHQHMRSLVWAWSCGALPHALHVKLRHLASVGSPDAVGSASPQQRGAGRLHLCQLSLGSVILVIKTSPAVAEGIVGDLWVQSLLDTGY